MRALAFALLAASCCAAATGRASDRVPPPADLARWTGTWNLGDTLLREGLGPFGPLKPEALRLLGQVVTDQVPQDARRRCQSPGFSGEMGGLLDNVELFASPGRLTIVSELGLVRRIFTDGRAVPADWPETREGLALGHWEGDGTLVVETTHLSPDVSYHLVGSNIVTLGRGAYITERLRLIDADHLRVDTTLVAPDLLTAPEQRTRVFVRAPADYVPRQWDSCWSEDRSIDPASGRQRFDLTPPADLPPPPIAPR